MVNRMKKSQWCYIKWFSLYILYSLHFGSAHTLVTEIKRNVNGNQHDYFQNAMRKRALTFKSRSSTDCELYHGPRVSLQCDRWRNGIRRNRIGGKT